MFWTLGKSFEPKALESWKIGLKHQFSQTRLLFCKSFFFGCAAHIAFASLFFLLVSRLDFTEVLFYHQRWESTSTSKPLWETSAVALANCSSSCRLSAWYPTSPKRSTKITWGEIPRETFPLNRWSLTFKKTSAWPCRAFLPRNFPSSSWSISRLVGFFFHPEWMVEHIFSLKAQWSTSIYEGRVKPPKTSGPPNFQQKQKQGRINLGSRFKYMGRYTSWATDNLPHRVQWKSHWTWVDRSKSRNQKPTVRERLASVFWKAFGEELGETTRKTLKNGWNMGGNESILEEFFKVSVVSPVPKPTGLVYGYLGTNPPTQDAIVDPTNIMNHF